jgi:putative SOS response-associated peptidase YedK
MCGRFGLFSSVEIIMDEFNVDKVLYEGGPRYNISPGQDAPVIRIDDGRVLDSIRWGLIPHWSKDEKIGNRMINARAETLDEKNAFRTPLRRSRCIVPADGFYEWKSMGKEKIPYFIRMKDERPFAMAGLYDTWKNESGEKIRTFTIITTDPNDLVRRIHDRMPAILERSDVDRWLDPDLTDPGELKSMLGPYEEDGMKEYRVSKAVNSSANESAEVIKPVDQWF